MVEGEEIVTQIIPLQCPKCQAPVLWGKDKGSWSKFTCPSCKCIFEVANKDIAVEGKVKVTVLEEREEPYNPSKRCVS